MQNKFDVLQVNYGLTNGLLYQSDMCYLFLMNVMWISKWDLEIQYNSMPKLTNDFY